MTKDNTHEKISKFLSFVLRHKPETIDLELDTHGWATISDLIAKAPQQMALTQALIEDVVATSDKQRFTVSDDGKKIRASQGHTIKIDLELTALTPPNVLYHGTATRFLESILEEGLQSRGRNHVHLSLDVETALAVGKRHGDPVILKVDSARLTADGGEFFKSDNDVWLTSSVPMTYLSVIGNMPEKA